VKVVKKSLLRKIQGVLSIQPKSNLSNTYEGPSELIRWKSQATFA
jgi:hypothetical protein